MKRAAYTLLLGAFFTPPAPAAPLGSLDTDGWHTWRVEAAEGAPAWCCFSRNGESTAPRACNLDNHSGNGNCNGATLNGFAHIYAEIESGKTVELRVLSPDCPVETDGGMTDHGEVDADDSFRWLSGLVETNSRVSEDAVAAIAVHRGERSREFLIDAAKEADADIRKAVIFWLAQTGAAESEEVILQAVAGDPDRGVREEAVFALSLLPEDRAVEALIAVVENRGLQQDVRENALFWLAQSESDRAMAVFERLLAGGDT